MSRSRGQILDGSQRLECLSDQGAALLEVEGFPLGGQVEGQTYPHGSGDTVTGQALKLSGFDLINFRAGVGHTEVWPFSR